MCGVWKFYVRERKHPVVKNKKERIGEREEKDIACVRTQSTPIGSALSSWGVAQALRWCLQAALHHLLGKRDMRMNIPSYCHHPWPAHLVQVLQGSTFLLVTAECCVSCQLLPAQSSCSCLTVPWQLSDMLNLKE